MGSSLQPPSGRMGTLKDGYCECNAVAKSAARNFYYAFLILPRRQRLAMCALYTFMRRTDDIGDGDLPLAERTRLLQAWRDQLGAALGKGPVEEPWWMALRDTVNSFSIPPELLYRVVDGVESDLKVARYDEFEDLYRYCYNVASVVGMACIRIWGTHDSAADRLAERCGVAFQLTNILRDVVEDYERGRIYLPIADLLRHQIDPDRLLDLRQRPALIESLRFQIARAHRFYDLSSDLSALLPPSGRAVFRALCGSYRGLLRKIERRPEAVFQQRVGLHSVQKAAHFAASLPTRCLGFRQPLAGRIA